MRDAIMGAGNHMQTRFWSFGSSAATTPSPATAERRVPFLVSRSTLSHYYFRRTRRYKSHPHLRLQPNLSAPDVNPERRIEPTHPFLRAAMAAGLKTIIALSFVWNSPPSNLALALTAIPGPRHRLPPCYSLRCTLPQLPHSSRCRYLCTCTTAELDMRAMCEP